MKIDSNSRSVDLDPRAAQFYENPYPSYHELRRKVPAFKWQQYGYWCFASHEDVNALLRDRRFGRQILHVATREELGLADIPARLKPFYDFEQHSLWNSSPRSIRGCAGWSTGPSCRARWSGCGQKSRVFRTG